MILEGRGKEPKFFTLTTGNKITDYDVAFQSSLNSCF